MKVVEHPYLGCNSLAMNLLSSLTYMKSEEVEAYFKEPQGKLCLGLVLSSTRLDVDNPSLREWSLVVVRNLCSWSQHISSELKSLEFIGVSEEGEKALDSLGVKDMYKKEINKLKREDLDSGEFKVDNCNVHVHKVDF